MIDVSNLISDDVYTQVFHANSDTATNYWQTWDKPKGVNFIYFFLLGGGAGGGAGAVGVGTARRGGGGGGSGGYYSALIPAALVPDRLYVQVGVGGKGGTTGNGTAGSTSRVSFQPATGAGNILFASENAAALPGQSTGTAGNGATIFTQTLGILGGFALSVSSSDNFGLAGTGGGLNTGGDGFSGLTYGIAGGGCGGGGASNTDLSGSGGTIFQMGFIPNVFGGFSGTTINGENGFVSMTPSTSLYTKNPFFSTGGAGGGANAISEGGKGGNGGYGCGGGGGGAGGTARGLGGDGGNGFVIISSW